MIQSGGIKDQATDLTSLTEKGGMEENWTNIPLFQGVPNLQTESLSKPPLTSLHSFPYKFFWDSMQVRIPDDSMNNLIAKYE